MSRSYQHWAWKNKFKSGFWPWCNGSNKKDKRFANRRFRRRSKQNQEDPPTKLNEVSDTWSFNTDGLAEYHDDSRSLDRDDIKRITRK